MILLWMSEIYRTRHLLDSFTMTIPYWLDNLTKLGQINLIGCFKGHHVWSIDLFQDCCRTVPIPERSELQERHWKWFWGAPKLTRSASYEYTYAGNTKRLVQSRCITTSQNVLTWLHWVVYSYLHNLLDSSYASWPAEARKTSNRGQWP